MVKAAENCYGRDATISTNRVAGALAYSVRRSSIGNTWTEARVGPAAIVMRDPLRAGHAPGRGDRGAEGSDQVSKGLEVVKTAGASCRSPGPAVRAHQALRRSPVLQRSRELTQGCSPKSTTHIQADRQERGLFCTARVKALAVLWCTASGRGGEIRCARLSGGVRTWSSNLQFLVTESTLRQAESVAVHSA